MESAELTEKKSKLIRALAGPLIFGGLLVAGYGAADGSWSTLAVAAAIAAAAIAVGFFIGFLFGIPRALTSERTPVAPPAGNLGRLDDSAREHYRPNTNLEQVSDWLTKILIGAGLVQLTSLTNGLNTLADNLKPALGDSDAAHVFGGAAVVYFLILGFLGGYLVTSLRLQGELQDLYGTNGGNGANGESAPPEDEARPEIAP